MLRKSIITVCLLVALFTAIELAKAAPLQKSHASDNEITFYHLNLKQPNEKQKVEATLHNLIGIDKVMYHPDKDAVTVTFEYDTMRGPWIEKALHSAGIPFKLKP